VTCAFMEFLHAQLSCHSVEPALWGITTISLGENIMAAKKAAKKKAPAKKKAAKKKAAKKK
jgi:glutamate/tyrosine decarboxylase-like PLP-dependent enzyme